MADTKTSALGLYITAFAAGDLFSFVDVSDTTMGVGGTNKRVTYATLVTSLSTAFQPLNATLTAIAAGDTIAAFSATQIGGGAAFFSQLFVGDDQISGANTGDQDLSGYATTPTAIALAIALG